MAREAGPKSPTAVRQTRHTKNSRGVLLREKEWKRGDQLLGIGWAEERSSERGRGWRRERGMRDGAERKRKEETGGGRAGGGGREVETERWQDGVKTLLPLQRRSGKKEGNGRSLPLIGTLCICLPDCPPTDHVVTYDAVTYDVERSDVQP